MWKVLIKDIETSRTEDKIECKSERNAEKVERGVNINLNHDKYYTEIIEE